MVRRGPSLLMFQDHTQKQHTR